MQVRSLSQRTEQWAGQVVKPGGTANVSGRYGQYLVSIGKAERVGPDEVHEALTEDSAPEAEPEAEAEAEAKPKRRRTTSSRK